MPLTREEINRKVLHLGALLMPAGIFYAPEIFVSLGMTELLSRWTPSIVLAILFSGSVIVEKIRMKNEFVQKLFMGMFGSMLRNEEKTATTGSTWIIGSALICSILFFDHPEISLMTLTVFILGDAVAALAGQSIGGRYFKVKLWRKSIEGSLSCFFLCLVFFIGLFPFLPHLLDKWGNSVPLLIAISAALSTTIFELVPLKIGKTLVINDNLAVPVITGSVMLLLRHFFY